MLTRRTILHTACAGAAVAWSARVRMAFAALPDDRRFIVVILRGGLDGLAAVAPYGDPDYASARGSLALSKANVIDLDGFFGLHPSLTNLSAMWKNKELALFHNISTPYRDRSHFDGQNVLETGGISPHLLQEGWLNRALGPLGLDTGNGALAVAPSPPLLLDGPAHVTSWMPSRMPMADEDFINRVNALYAHDPVLGAALKEALVTRTTVAAEAKPDVMVDPTDNTTNTNGQNAPRYDNMVPLVEGAGKIMAAPGGPRVAVFDVSGWDTHFNQGGADGQLARRLTALDTALAKLKETLGPAWEKTAVIMVTEFGRTVAVNGTGGTDHGTAGSAFLLGGAVAGGKVHAEWAGLKSSALKDGRDLPARTDMRALFKAALADHLGVPKQVLEARVFPDSAAASAASGLIRA